MLGSLALVLLGFVLGVALTGVAACFIAGIIYREAVQTAEANAGYFTLRTYEPHGHGAPHHDPV